MLRPLMDKYESFIVTEKTNYLVSNNDYKFYYLKQVNRHEFRLIYYMIYNILITMKIFLKEKPDIIISTGALATMLGTEGEKTIGRGAAGVAAGSASLQKGTETLQAGAKKLHDNSSTLNAGLTTLKDGGSQLASGVSQLASGANQVADGAGTLAGGTQTLLDGANTLADGNQTLADGMQEYKEEAIDKLTDLFNGDISGVTDRIDAMTNLAKEYKSFAGISDGVSGTTKFIIETEGIDD